MTTRGSTLAALVRAAAVRLAAISDAPRLEAELLAEHVFGLDRTRLLLCADTVPHHHAREAFERLVTQRTRAQPLAYLLGRQAFFDLEVQVTPDVLVPRADTEVLVGRALDRLHDRHPGGAVLELGTGSGAIALALVGVLRDLDVVATDVSAAALEVARQNWRDFAGQRGLASSSVRFVQGDWYEALRDRADLPARFDMIVSNPPYVATGERSLMSADTAAEPALALFAGADGLDAIRVIVAGAGARLVPGGRLLLEHGFRQDAAVRRLLTAAGFIEVGTWPDLGGQPRVTEGLRPAATAG